MTHILVPPRQLVTTQLFTMLRLWMPTVCRGFDHSTGGVAVKPPYWILYSISGGEWYGPPLTGPEDDVSFVYQVSNAGVRRDQAEYYADRLIDIVTGRDDTGVFRYEFPLIDGWSVADRMRHDVPGGVDPSGLTPNEVFSVANRFQVTITPS